ncbi:hypothetical protein ACFVYJ_05325 [Pontibacter sp. JAM-7]|uniref:hypothetical protein n=1 Tax=Pontibacter sp. JAM-7 TaxID=3366581 RepID=UPI003AF6AE17
MLMRHLLLCSLLLTGCNAAGVQPAPPESAPPSAPPQTEASSEQLDQLSGRISKIQEYLLQLKSQNGDMQQQNQALILQIQTVRDLLLQMADTATTQPQTEQSSDMTEALLDQLTDMMAAMQPALSGSYRMSSAYTAQGDWIVVRYDQVSGESWLAQSARWLPLEDQAQPASGDYEISLLRADQDKKGYVALRLDRLTGDSWWLNGTSWQRFAE